MRPHMVAGMGGGLPPGARMAGPNGPMTGPNGPTGGLRLNIPSQQQQINMGSGIGFCPFL